MRIVCPVCEGENKSCVACNGSGKVSPPKSTTRKWFHDNDGEFKIAAAKLKKAGYTLREIAKMLNIKHPQTVKNLIDTP